MIDNITVNFIPFKGLRHEQYQNLLRRSEADFQDLPYH